jgi:hypothetical protein
MEAIMKKIILSSCVFFAVLFGITAFKVTPAYATDTNYGPSDSSDYLTSDSVEGKDTNKLLDGDLVDGVPTKVPAPAATANEDMIEPDVVPTKAPVVKPQPTEIPEIPTPRPKPTAKPYVKPTPKKSAPRPTAVPTPVPTRAPIAFPGLEVSKAAISEIVMKRTAENFFGLLTTERKFTLNLVLENKGPSTSYYTVVTLKSGDTSLLTSDPEKNLGTVMPGSRLDIVYSLVVLGSYGGDLKLPLSVKITANGLVKEFPVEVYIEEAVPYLLYIGAGLLILLILLLIILALRGGKKGGQGKKGKDYDFEV